MSKAPKSTNLPKPPPPPPAQSPGPQPAVAQPPAAPGDHRRIVPSLSARPGSQCPVGRVQNLKALACKQLSRNKQGANTTKRCQKEQNAGLFRGLPFHKQAQTSSPPYALGHHTSTPLALTNKLQSMHGTNASLTIAASYESSPRLAMPLPKQQPLQPPGVVEGPHPVSC